MIKLKETYKFKKKIVYKNKQKIYLLIIMINIYFYKMKQKI